MHVDFDAPEGRNRRFWLADSPAVASVGILRLDDAGHAASASLPSSRITGQASLRVLDNTTASIPWSPYSLTMPPAPSQQLPSTNRVP